MRNICRVVLLAAAAVAGYAADKAASEKLYGTIRTNDLVRLKALLDADGARVNLADEHGATPLMYAAAAGSEDAMKLLIQRGAGVNARNQTGSTALMWCATDLKKVRLLVEHGADVNAVAKTGRSALLLASMSDHAAPVLRVLMAKGADPKVVDGTGENPLIVAALSPDLETIRLLVDAGLDVNARDDAGFTALMNAASIGNVAAVKLLLAKGAKVNVVSVKQPFGNVKNGPIALGFFTALNLAVPYGPPEVVRVLLDAGADVNQQDARGMTPLMLAVGTDRHYPEIVRMLLAKGADVNVKSAAGETALDWAEKMGHRGTLASLKEAGATAGPVQIVRTGDPAPADPKTAYHRGLALLERTSAEFFNNGGCIACHSQNMTDLTVGVARAKGLPFDEKAAAERLRMVRALFGPAGPALLDRMDPPGSPDTTLYTLAGLAATHYAADRMTDAMLANVVGMQAQDGGWHSGGVARPPFQDGDLFRTALAIRALQVFAPAGRAAEMKERMNAAGKWLLEAQVVSTEDRNMQLMGAQWAGMDAETLRKLAAQIRHEQHEDGGWGQRPDLPSDAYGTGQTLAALAQSGIVPMSDPGFQKGVKFLLSTQRADGSWYVRSRAPKLQPYFESGFPYGHDQWISTAATAWATMAVAYAVENAPQTRASR